MQDPSLSYPIQHKNVPATTESGRLGPVMPQPGSGQRSDEVLAIRNIITLGDIVLYVKRFWRLALVAGSALSLLLLILLTGRTPLFSSSTHLEVAIAEEGTWTPRQVLENSAVFLVNNHKLSLQTRTFQEYLYENIDEQDRIDFLEDRGFKKPLAAKGIALVKTAISGISTAVSSLFSSEDGVASDHYERDLFIKKLNESTIKILDEKESHIIRIEAKGPNSRLVASMANQYALLYTSYLAEENRNQARIRFDFLKATEQDYRKQAIESLRDLNRFRIENDVAGDGGLSGAVNDEVKRLNEERARIRVGYTTAESVLLQAEKVNEDWASLLSLPEVAEVSTIKERNKAFALKQQEYEASLSLYGPEHVKVKQAHYEVTSLLNLLNEDIEKLIQQFRITKETAEERLHSLDSELQKVLERVLDQDKNSLELTNLIARADSDKKTYEEILNKLNQAKVEMEVPETSKVRVIDMAFPAEKPFRPNKPLSFVISGFLFASILIGMPLCLGITEDFSRRLGIRIPYIHRDLPNEVGKIPTVHGSTALNMLAEMFSPGPQKDAIFRLVTNIQQNSETGGNTLLVTSAEEGEGKSFLSAALAGVFISQNEKALLIDCNLKAPSMSFWFPHLQTEANLVSWLTADGGFAIDFESLRHGESNLFILPAHGWATKPEALLAKPCLKSLIEHAREHFDIVILDGPQVNGYNDAAVLAAHADRILVASDPNISDFRQLATATAVLEAAKPGALLGIVSNRVDS